MLDRDVPCIGIEKESLAPYRAVGAQGFGIGSALYRPGMALDAVESAARAFSEAWAPVDA